VVIGFAVVPLSMYVAVLQRIREICQRRCNNPHNAG
jgi:hypothetical protein